uniref:Pentatricopeptide repeat n=1 Tax=Medicago truncatula TaxID=3880 RepID=A2Q2L2_MEDTR|nr:Pentatricopeptide repeat [Medicago truncatula]
MKGLCLNGQIDNAMEFHEKLVAQGYQLDHLTYGTLINALCKRRETGAAVFLLRQAERENVSLNVVTYNPIIDSLCKENRVTDAFDLFNEMVLKYNTSLLPDVVTYSPLINGLCIAG